MKANCILLLFTILSISCSNQKDLKVAAFTNEVCECFEQQKEGTIDERLDPCLSTPVNQNQNRIRKDHYPDLPAEKALSNYMSDVTLELIRTCDKFYYEMEGMYTDFYPKSAPEEFKDEIVALEASVAQAGQADSLLIPQFHNLINLTIRTRDFDSALKYIEKLEQKDSQIPGIYLARAYIQSANGNYDLAVKEIDKAILFDKNPDYKVLKAIIEKRKTTGNTKK